MRPAAPSSVSSSVAPPKGVGGALRDLAVAPLNWLLAAMVAAVVLHFCGAAELWVFVAASIAIIPLAGIMGRATENLASTMGAGVGGLLNATFGNAAELIIGLIALSKGPAMYPLVKASLTGSIIGNILLVLGGAMVVGGLKHRRMTFNRTMAGMGATLLALASIGLVMPTLFYSVATRAAAQAAGAGQVASLSEEIALILAVIYALSLVFEFVTHRHLFGGEGPEEPAGHESPEWNRTAAVTWLLLATAAVAWMSELLVGSVEHAAQALGMNQVFVGVIVVALVGNAAEHSTALLMAYKNKMDLAFRIAVGSGIQIALFVAPALVLASMLFSPQQPLDLHFTILEVATVLLAILVLAMVSQDGETHWMEGVMLLGVYLIAALTFYHLPGMGAGE